ncbi:MAG: DUF763 domain-containing protein, partial [Mesorhizobium sp.]
EGERQGEIVNLTDRRAEKARGGQIQLLKTMSPEKILTELAVLEPPEIVRPEPEPAAQPLLPNLVMPAHHDVRESDIVMRRLHGNISAAIESGPKDFPELLLVPGVGPRTVRALAMVSEVVHGAPYRFSDPARFSLAHGGKDRHPFPVPLKVYDETISVLKSAVGKARLGRDEELQALRRLDGESRRMERYVTGPSLKEIVAGEMDQSQLLGGRSVFGWEGAQSDDDSDLGAAR